MHRQSLFVTFGLCVLANAASAQSQTVINVPPDVAPSSIGSNTMVNLLDGGIITIPPLGTLHIGEFDGSSQNAVLNVEGGQLNAIAFASKIRVYPGGLLSIHGGEIVGGIEANGGQIAVEGGRLGNGAFDVGGGGSAVIMGGVLDRTVVAEMGGAVLVAGGGTGLLQAQPGGSISVSGGAFGVLSGESGGAVMLTGADFRLNGSPIAGLSSPGSTLQYDIPTNSVFTGVLADGSPFVIRSTATAPIAAGTLTLTAATLPPIGPSFIQASTDPLPHGIRTGQTLLVDNGGLVPKWFTAGAGSIVQIMPGSIVDNDFKAYQSTVSFSGGHVGGNEGFGFTAVETDVDLSGGHINKPILTYGSTLVMSGGEIGSELRLETGSKALISSGTVSRLDILADSLAKISGGAINGVITVASSGQAEISGGAFGSAGQIQAGLAAGSLLSLRGRSFLLNGAPINGLSLGEQFIVTNRNGTLSGILADRSSFTLPLVTIPPRGGTGQPLQGTVAITLVPEPVGSLLVLLGSLAFVRFKGKHQSS